MSQITESTIILTVKIEIYWPEGDNPAGCVVVDDRMSHLHFHRISPEDASLDTRGWWRMEEKYYLDDDVLVEAIKEKVAHDLLRGKMRLW